MFDAFRKTLRYRTGTDEVPAKANSDNASYILCGLLIIFLKSDKRAYREVQGNISNIYFAHLFRIIHTKRMPIISFCDMDRIRVGKPVADTITPTHQHTDTPAHKHTSTPTCTHCRRSRARS
jgi:hypothetical protein